MQNVKILLLSCLILVTFTACGGGGSGGALGSTQSKNSDYQLSYKGLTFFYQNKTSSQYGLAQLSNDDFNALSDENRLQVADKLFTTLFFGYPLKALKDKIATGNFIDSLHSELNKDSTDKEWLENYILNDEEFRQFQSSYYEPQAITILTRFYAMKKLDKYFLNNWIAYILTQTIMFSPAYELSSTHTPNISGVYNRIVNLLEQEAGIRFITYVHMMSEDNWRRFRSPEDNGREMMEIFLQDTDDSHVPIAGKALQNWKLNTDSDTLEVGLNKNTTPLSLFGTTIYNGDDFYRELVKSKYFTRGVTNRLVDFFFPEKSMAEKNSIESAIVKSNPETWQDILLQIIFSKEYLLHNSRAKSAEEEFYSLAKKMNYLHRRNTFYDLKSYLEKMHQASMKYKLGKLERVPLDTLSFAYYHKYIREYILMKRANPDYIDDHNSWSHFGWIDDYISFDKFIYDENDDVSSLKNFVDYLFKSTVTRVATPSEQLLFKNHMIENRDGEDVFLYEFDMFTQNNDPQVEATRRENNKRNIARTVLDYISRLDITYSMREVN